MCYFFNFLNFFLWQEKSDLLVRFINIPNGSIVSIAWRSGWVQAPAAQGEHGLNHASHNASKYTLHMFAHTQSELWSNSTAAIIKVPLNLQIEGYILIQSNGISVTEARAVPDYGLK